MKGSDLFVRCLENEGVEYIFGVPGEEVLDILDSLSRSKIKFIVTRHEHGAAFMADVYGRVTHTPGVCLSTLGPGATNLITGVADAYLDRVPLVAITGQADQEKTHKEVHQYIDIVGSFRHVTTWNTTIKRADFIPEIVRKAFDIAADAPGAVHIELPEDVAEEDTGKVPLQRKGKGHISSPGEEELKRVAGFIKNASMPIILAGNGVLREEASPELKEFVDRTGIPVATTFMGKGAIPADSHLYLGSVGIQEKDYIICGIDVADLVICIGFDPVEYSPRFWNPGASKNIVHIHSNHPVVDSSYLPEFILIGSIKETLKHLVTCCNFKKEIPEYFIKLKGIIEGELESFRDDTSFPMKPQKILYDIRKCLSRGDILISDVGAHKLWIGRLFPAYEPNTVIISNGLASMGFALPGAIAANLVLTEKKVVAAVGDGGFMMNVQELETARRLGCSFVVIIFNDSKYGSIDWKARIKFNKSFGVEFSNPDFVELAESFGANGVRIEREEEFAPLLKKALEDGGIWVFDVKVDYSENMKLSWKLKGDVCKF
ncbi:thiamine pyrophosphate-dependent enzyme, possible carboligase or decarboxylase [Candidatus Methanoperedens nitroreducens]|uniref:Thiamine pyrophosphate-dependent enzyme, possible carboligase or decarboxylase n=1 Tax=Candidatus Methanoperedens nitratireducens TaxID=1392998 RepID=A0A062V844_9EURY|nr:acetolactate synthase large subunit [Candidatus Methanoperedens nitroreducens]KCZ71550.1 thiamine pyrophosphate-dependent enzyme, possible carboligase or decarboxylase [Candidatus Methanoperedens nitroreducens]MDJ1421177.1 acetolactate synthase large subunit [Candidatus Methanoperedens sp.]